ncbi:MAG: hypothetical protein ACREXR_10725, partial [Gammaproteobacteria bacterium]
MSGKGNLIGGGPNGHSMDQVVRSQVENVDRARRSIDHEAKAAIGRDAYSTESGSSLHARQDLEARPVNRD